LGRKTVPKFSEARKSCDFRDPLEMIAGHVECHQASKRYEASRRKFDLVVVEDQLPKALLDPAHFNMSTDTGVGREAGINR
jgi:hypothetical protein